MKIAVFGTMWNEEVMRYYYRGFNRWAQETKGIVDVFVCYGRTDMDNPFNVGEYAIFDYPVLTNYDGAIIIGSNINVTQMREKLRKRIRKVGLPCVVIDYDIDGCSRIYIDQQDYIRQLVCHLAKEHDVKKISYIGGLSSNVESHLRLEGFYAGMKECNLEVREDWVFEESFRFDEGYDVVCDLLKNRDDFPEAFVCANDDMAAGVCEALQEAGIELGTECRVTGFDGYFLGENYAPSLTTVRRPRESMAYHACQMLAENSGIKVRKEDATLIFGKSCGCGSAYHNYNNDLEFRREIFNIFNHRDILSTMMANMEERMIAGKFLSDMFESIKKPFDRMGTEYCRIMLQPDLEKEMSAEYNSYRKCVKEYMLVQNDGQDRSDIQGHAYMYAPIHFLDHLYGICIFRDIPYLMVNKELYNFTKSIGYSIENIVQKKEYSIVNDQLESLYETDYLTGAYNRHGFAKYADEMLRSCRMKGKELQIFFFDIDGLKKINDKYGHEAGDVVIRVIGNASCQVADDKTKVFRYGGDEFLVLREGESEPDELISRVEKEIEAKRRVMNLPYEVGASMGCVIAKPGEQKTLEEYVKEADHIMYQIKQERHQKRD